MKKLFLILITAIVMTGCYTSEDQKQLRDECRSLEAQKSSLTSEISRLQSRKSTLSTDVTQLEREKAALKNGKEPVYIVKFEHIKNSMNAIEVEIPVNKDFYNRLSVGQDITDSFKYGSLIMDGDFSTLHMRVKNKRIE